MLDYKVLTLCDAGIWNDYLNRLPLSQQDVYFTPEYYRLYEENGDGKAMCFVFEDDENIALYPFLLNSINALGYQLDQEYYDIQGAYGYNGVVSSCYAKQFIESFYNAFCKYCSDTKIIAEFTRFHPLIENKVFSEKHMQIVYDRKTMYVELDRPFDAIFKTFQTTTRKQIKRSTQRYNLEIVVSRKDISQINAFYSIYYEAMKRVNSVEYLFFSEEYFRKLISNTASILLIAKYESKPIAGIIAFCNGVYMHGHLGGALTDYLHTSVFSLLYSEMIKIGIENGCKYYHAGGGATNTPDDKLLQFKKNFSNTLADFHIGKKIHNQKVYDQVVEQWSTRYPEKVERYKNLLLKYRF